jgi:uncharacterized protein
VILLSLLAVLVNEDLQRLNGLKNALVLIVNLTSALLFMFMAPVAWPAVLLIAIRSVVGGQVGAVVGRRLPPAALRAAIVIVGTVVAVRLLTT